MLCLIWFLGVYAEGGKTYLNNLLFRQTVHRAVDAFHHKQPFWYYFKTIWHSLAPWVLFYLTVILIGFRDKLYHRDIEKFFSQLSFLHSSCYRCSAVNWISICFRYFP